MNGHNAWGISGYRMAHAHGTHINRQVVSQLGSAACRKQARQQSRQAADQSLIIVLHGMPLTTANIGLGTGFQAAEINRHGQPKQHVGRVFGQTEAETQVNDSVLGRAQTNRGIHNTGCRVFGAGNTPTIKEKLGIEIIGLLIAGAQRHLVGQRIS